MDEKAKRLTACAEPAEHLLGRDKAAASNKILQVQVLTHRRQTSRLSETILCVVRTQSQPAGPLRCRGSTLLCGTGADDGHRDERLWFELVRECPGSVLIGGDGGQGGLKTKTTQARHKEAACVSTANSFT